VCKVCGKETNIININCYYFLSDIRIVLNTQEFTAFRYDSINYLQTKWKKISFIIGTNITEVNAL
jgi:hypothetical protein